MSRALGCQYKTAFVLIHKLRAALMDNQDDTNFSGAVTTKTFITKGECCFCGSVNNSVSIR